jgi:hypothetical protein
VGLRVGLRMSNRHALPKGVCQTANGAAGERGLHR